INWRVDLVDEAVWKWLVDRINNPELVSKEITRELSDDSKILSLKQDKKNLRKKIASLEKEEENYILLFGKNKISEKQFDNFTTPIKENIKLLKQELLFVENQLLSINNETNEAEMILSNIILYQQAVNNELLTVK